jgi:hypothetical protein
MGLSSIISPPLGGEEVAGFCCQVPAELRLGRSPINEAVVINRFVFAG